MLTIEQIAIGRIIGVIVTAIGIGVSIWFARTAIRMNAEFYEWIDARPMETAVDLSQPGEVVVPFRQTCGVSHGEVLFFDYESEGLDEEKLEDLFKDLSSNVAIVDSGGNEIENLAINNKSVHYWDGKIVLARFAPFPEGDFMATIRVDSGVPTLAGRQQTIHAEYQLCGLEQMPAIIAAAIAFGAGFIGLVSGLCVLPGLVRSGIWRLSEVD